MRTISKDIQMIKFSSENKTDYEMGLASGMQLSMTEEPKIDSYGIKFLYGNNKVKGSVYMTWDDLTRDLEKMTPDEALSFQMELEDSLEALLEDVAARTSKVVGDWKPFLD